MQPWLRRLMTRSIAIIPAAVVVAVAGSTGTYRLLIISQA
jgi:manganese transport protein